jgi:hypothetical protein
MAIGCEISQKDTKHTDKCNNKLKVTQKQNNETIDKYFSKYCENNTVAKEHFTHIMSNF